MIRAATLLFAAAALSARAPNRPQPQMDRVRADLRYLTSEKLAGRVSLSPEADMAAHYIADQFRKAGLKPGNGNSYLQPFRMIAYTPDIGTQMLLLTRGGAARHISPPDFSGRFYRNIDVRGEAVFAGYGITAPEYGYDDYAGTSVKGKIVVIFDHEPQEDDPKSIFHGTGHTLHAGRWMKVENARRHGAIAVLIGPDILHHQQPRPNPTRPPLRAGAPPQSLDDPGQIPAFSISQTALRDLLEPLHTSPIDLERSIDAKLKPASASLPDTRLEIRSRNREHHRGTSLNVAGLWEGSDPTLKAETIMLTAHYDHLGIQNGRLYPGANDNASGTVAVMELARLFAESGIHPKRGILFVVFGSEEQLMMGSFYYTSHPLRPLATTRAVLNLDMIGRNEAHIHQDEGGLHIPADTSNLIDLVGSFYSPDLRSDLVA
ncbi:MAG TPA: M28 family peptidase, partial [Bryobacteraceae bacterium]